MDVAITRPEPFAQSTLSGAAARRHPRLAPHPVGTILRDVFAPPPAEDPAIAALLAQLDRS